MLKVPVLMFLLWILTAVPVVQAEFRTFTNDFGNEIEAELVEYGKDREGEWVKIRFRDGRVIRSMITMFSEADIAYIREWQQKQELEKSVLNARVRLEMAFKTNKKSQNKYDSSYADNVISRFKPELTIENGDNGQTYTGNKVRFIILAKDLRNKHAVLVASVTDQEVDFSAGGEALIRGKPFSLEYYKEEGWGSDNYRRGYEYNSHIVVVRNRNGEITHTKSGSTKMLENMDNIMRCKPGQMYTTDMSEKLNISPDSYYIR